MEPQRLAVESRTPRPAVVASGYEEANRIVEGLVEGDVAYQGGLGLPSEDIAPEVVGIVREIRAKIERVDAKLCSLRAVVAETRVWTERVELAHRVQQAQEAEERVARIVAEAEMRASRLLASAERAAAGRPTISADRITTPEPEAAEVQGPEAFSVDAHEAEALYDAIDLFTRTNADVVQELSALLKILPARVSEPNG